MKSNPELSIIIVSYNVKDLLLKCLESIIDTASDIFYEIIVVDNDSYDGSVDAVKQHYPQVRIIVNKENAGFARANNQASQISRGKSLLFLNPDTLFIHDDTLPSLLSCIKSASSVGVVGCQLLNRNQTLQTSYGHFPSAYRVLFENMLSIYRFIENHFNIKANPRRTPKEVDYVKGACFLISTELFKRLGGFDEDFFMYSEERDLCYRVKKAGYRVLFIPSVQIIHYGEQSGGMFDIPLHKQLYESQILFLEKHYGRIHLFIFKCLIHLGIISRFIIWWMLNIILPENQNINKRYQLFKALLFTAQRSCNQKIERR